MIQTNYHKHHNPNGYSAHTILMNPNGYIAHKTT